MNAQHTPGPWELAGRATIRTRALVPNIGRKFIAHVHWRNGRANADLIAAAPEMLDALRQCVIALAHASANDPTHDAAYKAADAAIAKAMGMAANTRNQPSARSDDRLD